MFVSFAWAYGKIECMSPRVSLLVMVWVTLVTFCIPCDILDWVGMKSLIDDKFVLLVDTDSGIVVDPLKTDHICPRCSIESGSMDILAVRVFIWVVRRPYDLVRATGVDGKTNRSIDNI